MTAPVAGDGWDAAAAPAPVNGIAAPVAPVGWEAAQPAATGWE